MPTNSWFPRGERRVEKGEKLWRRGREMRGRRRVTRELATSDAMKWTAGLRPMEEARMTSSRTVIGGERIAAIRAAEKASVKGGGGGEAGWIKEGHWKKNPNP